jgi:hypothetical protein
MVISKRRAAIFAIFGPWADLHRNISKTIEFAFMPNLASDHRAL